MKPIAKAMTAALGTLIATTTACATPGEHRQAGVTPAIDRQRIVAATDDGFVLRAPIPARTDAIAMPVLRNHVPLGSSTHIDADLLSRPANTFQETSHANP
jgi:hypothetical protein